MCQVKSLTKRAGFVIAAYLFCFVIVVFAQEEAMPQQVPEWQKAAADYQKSGNLAAALAEYEKIIQSSPNTPYGLDACAKVASLYVTQKQFENLQSLITQLCTNFHDQPGVFRVLSELVKNCMYAKAYPEALSLCSEVESYFCSHPRRTLITGWRGMVHAHQDNVAEVEQLVKILIKQESIASDFLDAMKDIGWGYFCAGRLDEAVAIYRQGITRHPDHSAAVYLQYHVVQACLKKSDPKAADREMEMLLTQYGHRPNTPALACRLAKEYRQKGYAQQEIAVYQSLLERFPEHEEVPAIWDSIVETYTDAGDLTKAIEALKINIKHYPKRRELARMITRVAVETARQGDTDTAMKLVSDIFDQAPQGPDQLFGYTTLARVYVHQGRDAEAEATVNEALERFKDYPDELAYHLFGVGEEYHYRAQKANSVGNVAEAKANYQKTIAAMGSYMALLSEKHYRNRSMAYYIMAMGYCQLGEWRAAADAFEDSVEADPHYKYADYCLYAKGDCYRKLMVSEAISTAEAIPVLSETYSELVLKYPESIHISDAKLWLQEN